ncbi:MAG: SDR family NAD(P)-dependent oxidoreductase [Myxococcota bacterium]|nr:SDR family NAD(P)-dependent oxidoreductase [Myxococcota bacterium]
MSSMERWRGKVALVTGASAGIGRAIAQDLSKAGMRLVLLARRLERLETLCADIRTSGGEAVAVAADLRDTEQIGAAFERAREHFGGVDVLINNAGIGRIAPLMSGKTGFFRELLEVNVLALTVATREAIQDMLQRDAAGHVIHISSMSGHRVQAGSGMYAATKFAVRALTEGLRRELREAGSPIRVSSISPADTASEFFENLYKSAGLKEADPPPYRKMDASDVASAVSYILGTPPHVEVHDLLLRPIDQPD